MRALAAIPVVEDGVVRGDGLAHAVEQRLERLVHEVDAPHALAQRVFAQGLAWNRAGVHACATDLAIALDDRDTFASLGGLDGGLLTRGA